MLNLILRLFGRPTAALQYRIKRRLGGYEPQVSYNAGIAPGLFWFPMDENGYWLEPDAFTHGKTTMHVTMTKEAAKRAILRAKTINRQNTLRVAG